MAFNNALPSPPEWDLLLSAAQKNRPDLIRSIVVDGGVDPSHANGVGQSALHVAALWGHTESVECLLQVGANVTARNSLSGATPLHMVLSSHKGTFANKLQVVDLLLQHDNGIHNLSTMTDQYGRLPIDYLTTSMTTTTENDNSSSSGASSAEQEAYIAAITEKLKPVDPPLFTAIGNVDVPKVRELLLLTTTGGVDDDDTTFRQEKEEDATTIMVNITFRNATPVGKTVQLLVATAEEALTQATAAAAQSSSEDSSDSTSTIYNEKMQQLVEILNLILKAGGKPNLPESITSSSSTIPGESIDPPLVQVLQALVEAYREQQNQQDETNTATATATAAATSRSIAALKEAAVALHKAGAVLTTSQVAAFLHASARGSAGGLPMAQFLLQKPKSDDDDGDDDDDDDDDNVGGLNLDVNATNRQGMTPLQFAARSGRADIVQYLLTLTPTINVYHQDNVGQTALDAARKNNKEQVVHILEKYIQTHPVGDGDGERTNPS
jgi:ankyrin repeat protein